MEQAEIIDTFWTYQCARRAPTEKKTYSSRVLGGKDLAQRPISEASDISGKTTQPDQEMGRKLVPGSRRWRSRRVGNRSDGGNVGSSKVRLAEPVGQHELAAGRRLAHEGARGWCCRSTGSGDGVSGLWNSGWRS